MTFEEFVEARLQALLRYAVMLTGDPHLAQDLVQETMIRAQLKWCRIAAADLPERYVKRMLTNVYMDLHRGSWLRRVLLRGMDIEAAGEPRVVPDHADGLAERDQMWLWLGRLPRQQRAALVLRYYEGLTDGEIAEILGRPPGVQSRHLAYDGAGGLGEPGYGRAPVVYEPGCRHYEARLAVDYLRASVGGGDERAVRAYLTALAAAAADPARLPALLNAAGQGLELHLGARSLAGLAGALHGIGADRVTVLRLPAGMPDGDGLYPALRAGQVGPWLAAHPQYAV
ncbi:SigE family RNA polymerase sigma factor [Dactylosporangium sp. CA-139066]|uniref:SigE family RNA polymerase sigma factor n=1 Tax=Dactylosporangium sp. CA-139066 TaxID=3239930 RepID=UPI003D9178EA